MFDDNKKFWDVHEHFANKTFDSEFKDLFNSMIKFNSSKRMFLGEVKKHPWYQGEVYSKEEL